jgi:hypothetical protein
VILVDANILLYAYNSSSEHHEPAKQWLEHSLSLSEPVRFSWITILAFLRITTNIHAYPNPLTPGEAVRAVSDWFSRSNVDVLNPGERYWQILSDLLIDRQARGPIVMDAHLAALAVEHGAEICTHDEDFSRFPDITTLDPCKGK